jgi:multidrug resistance efflux pump
MDQRAADAQSRQGLLKSAQANMDRLKVLENYKRITAPFDGLVTARTTDVGCADQCGRAAGPRCSSCRTWRGCAPT